MTERTTRKVLVPGEKTHEVKVNGVTETLPIDPVRAARMLSERRSPSPASKLKAKMAKDISSRVFGIRGSR